MRPHGMPDALPLPLNPRSADAAPAGEHLHVSDPAEDDLYEKCAGPERKYAKEHEARNPPPCLMLCFSAIFKRAAQLLRGPNTQPIRRSRFLRVCCGAGRSCFAYCVFRDDDVYCSMLQPLCCPIGTRGSRGLASTYLRCAVFYRPRVLHWCCGARALLSS